VFPLIGSFFLIAFLYSMVGFGGGSSYIAILAAAGVPYSVIPKLSLTCNLLVVTGGLYHYIKNGHFSGRLMLPFVLSSVPLAFVGGMFPIGEKTFFILLTASLILCGLRILFLPDRKVEDVKAPPFWIALLVGGALGLLSGMVGIGGGIFLSPLLINLGWARSKNAAAVASAFIFLNSIAGLAGQLTKDPNVLPLGDYFPLLLSVVLGGQIGSRVGSHQSVSFGLVQKGTGILTLFISIKLLMKYV
jgi:uncharacterized membrane protein YfcA